MNIPPKYEDLVFQLNELNKREAALREEIEMAKQVQETTDAIVTMVDGQRDHWIEKCGLLKQRLTVAERRSEMLEREFKKLRDVAHGCYQIASSYSGCIDGVEESGGDDHDDPSCAIFHRLYYAMFDADAALKTAAEPTIEVARQSLSFENQRIQPARFHCLACGEYHEGSGNLPCPKMKPMSGVKP